VVIGDGLLPIGEPAPGVVGFGRRKATLAPRWWEDAEMTKGTVGLVLAAGAGSRFGGDKLLATIGGRPVLQHVLDVLAEAGVGEAVVVLGHDAERIELAIDWGGARRVVNLEPERGLSSSLQVGFEAIGPDAAAVLVALGDQPLVSAAVIRTLLDARPKAGSPIVVPIYPDDRGRNPVLVRREAFALVGEATGDRGLGPLLEAHPELVEEIPVDAANPDIDTPADLARAIEASWGARVRANREQVERLREVPDGADFYAPVSSLFRADPTRTDDPVLDTLLALVRSGETWLDIGAGAGRFALPIARALDPSGGSVVALDPSRSMLEGLLEIAEDYAIENVRTIEARWPLADARAVADVEADVTLIAHVGYDVEEIGPFVDGLETAAQRLCVAVLMEQVPAAAANPFWPPVHGEERVPLPALPDLLELLQARGRRPSVERHAIEPRLFESRDAIEGFVRRQLWIDPDGPKEKRFQAALDALLVEGEGGWALVGRGASTVGVVTWSPR
jgi:CTP:molybdopterin cytidylyltransferase MocA/SAM-dependent methyltransferase